MNVTDHACANDGTGSATGDTKHWFLGSHYGLFTHYTYRNPSIHQTIFPDGSHPAHLDDLGDQFNAVQFAADVSAFGVDYVTFTAWHAEMNVLYPSAKNQAWRLGHATTRDVIRDLIDALQPYNIKLMLYIQ